MTYTLKQLAKETVTFLTREEVKIAADQNITLENGESL